MLGNSRIVGRLRERVREQLVDVRFAVAVGVAQPPDAVAIEDEDLLVADGEAQRFVEARREPPPAAPRRRFSPRATQTSPSSVTTTPVPSLRNWMSPGRTLRRQGFAAGSAMSSTTNASVAVERVIAVATSCGQRGVGSAVRTAAIGNRRRVPGRRPSSRTGGWCRGARRLLSAITVSDPIVTDSSVAAFSLPSQTATVVFGDFAPSISHNVPGDGPTSNWRTIALGEGAPAVDRRIHSRTSAPPADVLEHDAAVDQAHGFEAAHRLGQRTAADLLACVGAGSRGSSGDGSRAGLPSGIDPVGDPHGPVRLGQRGLPALRFAIGHLIRARRERARRDAVTFPDRRRRAADRCRSRPSGRRRGSAPARAG